MTKLLLFGLSLSWPAFLISALAATELPQPGSLIVPALIMIVLIFLNGLFVAAEFAIIGVRPTQIEQRANEGDRTAKIVLAELRSSEKQNRYIATAQLGISITSLGLGMYGEKEISRFVEPYLTQLLGFALHETLIFTIGYIFSVSVLTYLHVVLGEMIPKSLALSAPDKAALSLAHFMSLLQRVVALPVHLLNGISNLLLNLFRIPPVEGQERLHSPEELELIVRESTQGGLLQVSEEELIRNIFDFSERKVYQVMTPRPRLEAIPQDMPLPELLTLVTNSHYSRFPVYERDLDHIIGIVHIKDLVRQYTRLKGNFDIRLLLRPAPVVPENYPVAKLLNTLKRRKHHMAIVLDEFGGTAGVVTMEDLVEEVVGEVRDEFDVESEPLVEIGPGELEVSGNYLIEDLTEIVDLGDEEDLPEVDTVGGLIMSELGRLPQPGDQVSWNNGQVKFSVLTVDGLAVGRARVQFSIPAPPEPNQHHSST